MVPTVKQILPKHVVFEVISACNLDCLYCYNVWKSPHAAYPKGHLSLPKLIKLMDKICNELPLESVAISGGEPFLRADLPQIVAYFWARRIKTVIITNGTLLTRENIERTNGANNYELPLLSYKREVHNYLTQNDSFDRVILGMKHIVESGGHFAVAFIATRQNYDDLDRTAQLAIAMGADGILYNRVNVSAHNYRYLKELLPSIEMVRENLDVLEAMAREYKIPISSAIPIQPCLINTKKYEHIRFGFCPLAGENSYFTIDALGNLRVCNHSSKILGNLFEKSFSELVCLPYVQKFQSAVPQECNLCPIQVREQCHGGCKMAAEECFGSMTALDPFLKCHLSERMIPICAN